MCQSETGDGPPCSQRAPTAPLLSAERGGFPGEQFASDGSSSPLDPHPNQRQRSKTLYPLPPLEPPKGRTPLFLSLFPSLSPPCLANCEAKISHCPRAAVLNARENPDVQNSALDSFTYYFFLKELSHFLIPSNGEGLRNGVSFLLTGS